jgi:uncharacterized protein (DUF433 family)
MSPRIVDRGRGPEIAGTRVTVYRIMDFVRAGSTPAQIASELELDRTQVAVALDYIDANRAEVERMCSKISARESRHRAQQELPIELSRSFEDLKSRR